MLLRLLRNQCARILVLFSFLVLPVVAHSKVIIDASALATETVLPKFSDKDVVKRKKVSLQGKFSAAGFVGLLRNNAFFDAVNTTLLLDYNLTEEHAIQTMIGLFVSKPSSSTEALNELNSIENLDLAPEPSFLLAVNYKMIPWYGKVSWSKDKIYNFVLSGSVGPAMFKIGNKFFPALNIGIGPNIYFGGGWGLAVDFRGLIYNGPDPLSVDLTGVTETPDAGLFAEFFNFNLLLNIGLTKVF